MWLYHVNRRKRLADLALRRVSILLNRQEQSLLCDFAGMNMISAASGSERRSRNLLDAGARSRPLGVLICLNNTTGYEKEKP
jgi:hypothetical protein